MFQFVEWHILMGVKLPVCLKVYIWKNHQIDLVDAKIIFCFHALVSITNSYITQFRSFLVELISLALYIAIPYLVLD
jgi:hypothetical protein